MLLSRHTRRRELIALIGGAAFAWPFSARAQQGERLRRIGVLMNNDNAEARANYAAFLQALKQLGWVDGHNVRIDARSARGQASEIRKYAVEIVALTPDVIVTGGAAAMVPLMEASRTVPIVFVNVADPVGAGYVDTMSRPGGNATGFVQFEYSLSGKWLELLKQIAPNVTRAAILRDPSDPAGIGQFSAIQIAAVHPDRGSRRLPKRSSWVLVTVIVSRRAPVCARALALRILVAASIGIDPPDLVPAASWWALATGSFF